jgi:hypothetical protein
MLENIILAAFSRATVPISKVKLFYGETSQPSMSVRLSSQQPNFVNSIYYISHRTRERPFNTAQFWYVLIGACLSETIINATKRRKADGDGACS